MTASNTMMIQEHDGAAIEHQVLVLPEYRDVDWRPLFKLEIVPAPGLPDIKWNELYSKWGKFVPEDKKQGLSYFVEEPPATVKRKIAAQRAQAKSAREKRSRKGDDDNVVRQKKPGPKKASRKLQQL